MCKSPFLSYRPPRLSAAESVRRARDFEQLMAARRSVRHFSADPVPRELIETAIATASSAPSGAHRQPWRFVVVGNADVKRQIRVQAEAEERISYEGGRMPPEWLEALAPLGTDWRKPYLETVPWIVVVFEELYSLEANGRRRKNYYVKESVGIACGLFVTALAQHGSRHPDAYAESDEIPVRRPGAGRRTRSRTFCSPWAIRPPTRPSRTCVKNRSTKSPCGFHELRTPGAMRRGGRAIACLHHHTVWLQCDSGRLVHWYQSTSLRVAPLRQGDPAGMPGTAAVGCWVRRLARAGLPNEFADNKALM